VSGRIQLLATLLGLQLLLVAGFLYVDVSGAADDAPSFLEFVREDVDRLVIAGEGDEIEVAKGDNGWSLAGGTPADADKIVDVLDKLENLNAPWPVATSEGSRERFEVTQDINQRHVQLFAGEEAVAELYLGTSPGYRRVHARAADADAVYSIDFSTFELPVAADDWLDKDLLHAAGEVTEVRRDGAWTLSKSEEGWMLGAAPPALGAADAGALDPEAVEKLVERIADLRVTGFAADDADLTEKGAFTVTDDAGNHQLRLYHDAEEDSYAIESNRIAGRFAVATYVAEQVIVAEEDLRLVEEKAEEAGELELSG